MKATGVVLSGGRSSRMRSNKAFVEVHGQRIIESVLAKLCGIMDDVLLVTNDPEAYIKYESERLRVVTDIIPGKGPLSGIHAGLHYARHRSIVAVACDMPFLNPDFLLYMIDQTDGLDAVVPRIGEYFQPLCAVYRKSCYEPLQNALMNDQLKISRLYDLLNIRYIDEKEIRVYGDPDLMFFNVNNHDDLQKAEQVAREVL